MKNPNLVITEIKRKNWFKKIITVEVKKNTNIHVNYTYFGLYTFSYKMGKKYTIEIWPWERFRIGDCVDGNWFIDRVISFFN